MKVKHLMEALKSFDEELEITVLINSEISYKIKHVCETESSWFKDQDEKSRILIDATDD